MDFKNRCNVGYAFINFIDPKAISSFALRVCGKKWRQFNSGSAACEVRRSVVGRYLWTFHVPSDKVCTIAFANIQGKQALVDKFRNSQVMEEEESYRPKIFCSSGPLRGQEEQFPPPTITKRSMWGGVGVGGFTGMSSESGSSSSLRGGGGSGTSTFGSFLYNPSA